MNVVAEVLSALCANSYVRGLTVTESAGKICVEGKSRSFHHKQLAGEVAMGVLRKLNVKLSIDNKIEVD